MYVCISLDLQYTLEDAVQICGKFWDTQYIVNIYACRKSFVRVKEDKNKDSRTISFY